MKSSYKIFNIKGIDVKIHITLLILLLLPAVELSSYDTLAEGVVFAGYLFTFLIILFSSVLIHELAHSFVALRNKIEVKQIILWPLGGLASIGMVKDPKKELKISVAGPLSSLGIGFSLLIILLAVVGIEPISESIVSGDVLSAPSLFNLVVLTMYINLILGAFNLFLPIFPMDGGRVLRSMLSMVTDRVTSTKIAVAIGQVFLGVFIVLAIMVGSLWLIIIGVFLFIAGLSELRMTELSAMAEKVDLDKVIKKGFMAVHPDLKITDLLQIVVPWQSIYPVLDMEGKIVGIVEPENLADNKGRVRDVMVKKFPNIRLKEKKDQILTKVYTEGYVFVLNDDGSLYGILTLQNLQKAIQMESKRKGQ